MRHLLKTTIKNVMSDERLYLDNVVKDYFNREAAMDFGQFGLRETLKEEPDKSSEDPGGTGNYPAAAKIREEVVPR
jgi:hypothetical protein